jgi:hypothetical protein
MHIEANAAFSFATLKPHCCVVMHMCTVQAGGMKAQRNNGLTLVNTAIGSGAIWQPGYHSAIYTAASMQDVTERASSRCIT